MLAADSCDTKRPGRIDGVAFCALALQLLLALPSVARDHAFKQEQQPQPLGSLSKIGEVYVNDQPVSTAESTIFTGDKLRTAENGVASFAVSGRGTIKFAPNTFVVFAATEQYIADLRSGSAVISSFSGPGGLALRIGDFVVIPAVQEQQTTARVERSLAGATSVTSLEGSATVVSLQGGAGLLLQAGQSTTISESGQLNPETPAVPGPVSGDKNPPVEEPPQPAPPTGTPPPSSQHKSRKGWIILGLAGAGAAAIAGAAAGGGGGHQPVSPSSP